MNLKEMLKRMSYKERIELINEQIKYYEDLKKQYSSFTNFYSSFDKRFWQDNIDDQIEYYKKVLETIKIWK